LTNGLKEPIAHQELNIRRYTAAEEQRYTFIKNGTKKRYKLKQKTIGRSYPSVKEPLFSTFGPFIHQYKLENYGEPL
jgi:hypothetical protein